MKIYYIAGNGHSGSTLLDMMVGQSDSCFSGGELTFVVRGGIEKERCSCGKRIGECDLWGQVMESWTSRRSISMEEYRKLWWRFEPNKVLPRLLYNVVWPSDDFLKYCDATKCFFEAIEEVTGKYTVVDSSKSAPRILILRRFADVTVLHICRSFTGVANSVSKFSTKDIEKGVERDIFPTPLHQALASWLLNNLLASLFCAGLTKIRVSYAELVREPAKSLAMLGLEPGSLDTNSIEADHMLAGNIIRLRKNIALSATVGFQYKRLNKFELGVCKIIDIIFWFWR